tara:strand:- start:48 stop:1763 length:1716 start_codon:yes stop_codon:yes gene_type:complete
VQNTEIISICGPSSTNFVPVNPTDNSYVFQNDPAFPALNLYDFFGRGATVNSFQECAYYVQEGWEPFKITIFDYLQLFTVISVFFLFYFVSKKLKFTNYIKKINIYKDIKKLGLTKFFWHATKNRKVRNYFLGTFIIVQHFFIFDYIRTKSVRVDSFIDEYVVLTSNVNFFKNFDFNAGDFIGGSYSVMLTSGPISAIGSVISWNITNNFILGRISNFYFLILLQVLFSIAIFKKHKLDSKLILGFNGLVLLSIPWWQGALYSLGEIASMIIFTNSVFLFHKLRKLSMFLFSVSIFYGKLLTLLPFLGFYGAYIFKKRKVINIINEAVYFFVPLALWLLLVQIYYDSGNLNDYFVDQYYLIINHAGSGVSSLDTGQFFNLKQNIFQTEIINWNTYDRLRLIVIPLITTAILFNNKEKVDNVFNNLSIPLIFSILIPYIWFWFFNSNKWMRYSQHFSVVVIIVLLYLTFSGINFSRIYYLTITSMFSLFITNVKFLIAVFIITSLILILSFQKKRLQIFIQILLIVIFTLDISIPYFEKNTFGNLNSFIEECELTLLDERCLEAYMRKLSRE